MPDDIQITWFRLQMFDTTSENPELIWNDATRRNVRESVKKILDQLVTAQSVDPAHKSGAALPDSVAYQSVVDGEMIGMERNRR